MKIMNATLRESPDWQAGCIRLLGCMASGFNSFSTAATDLEVVTTLVDMGFNLRCCS